MLFHNAEDLYKYLEDVDPTISLVTYNLSALQDRFQERNVIDLKCIPEISIEDIEEYFDPANKKIYVLNSPPIEVMWRVIRYAIVLGEDCLIIADNKCLELLNNLHRIIDLVE